MGDDCSEWIDLPAGSFKEQGTNVNTAIVVFDVQITSAHRSPFHRVMTKALAIE